MNQKTTLLIATGLGLHNLSEGLAIGQSAATGAVNPLVESFCEWLTQEGLDTEQSINVLAQSMETKA